MPRHHVRHVRNVGPILFARNENIAHVMPHVTACAMMSCTHRAAHTQASKLATIIICGMPGFTYGHAVRASQMIFI